MDIIRSIIVWFTGTLFVLITFPLNLFLWLALYPFDKERKCLHSVLMSESLMLSFLMPAWSLKIEGRKKAKKNASYVMISNHQSMLDILILNCLKYRYKWISKIENFKVPVIGWYLRMADYIVFNRSDDESKGIMLERSYNCLKKGISIMIFPEGTRSLDCEIGFFKRGAFQLAIQASVPILPIVLDGTGGILPKHGLIFGSRHKVILRVLDPVAPEDFGTSIPEELALHFSEIYKAELVSMRSQNS